MVLHVEEQYVSYYITDLTSFEVLRLEKPTQLLQFCSKKCFVHFIV